MADTENKLEALEQEVVEASANPQADAPKKNVVWQQNLLISTSNE